MTLMTLHSAKGLEFPVVFMVGVEEGSLPHQRATSSEEELEEERRLCYVGITRAKEQVYLTHANSRRLYGYEERRTRSRFIKEIPEDLLEQVDGSQPTRRASVSSYDPDEPDHDLEVPFNYQTGDIVYHTQFGRGKITSISGYGADMRVTVLFSRGVEKTMMAAFAPLQKLE